LIFIKLGIILFWIILQKLKFWPVFILGISSFIFLISFGIVFNNVSPRISPQIAFPLFYSTFFLATFSLFALFSSLFQIGFLRGSLGKKIHSAIRQGILMAILACSLTVLQQFKILNFWISILVFIIIILIEIFFWDSEKTY